MPIITAFNNFFSFSAAKEGVVAVNTLGAIAAAAVSFKKLRRSIFLSFISPSPVFYLTLIP